MSASKLKNAPLKEVILELHWECDINEFGILNDSGFELGQGKFSEKIKSVLPLHRKLISNESNSSVFGVPVHQYWAGELQWPVVQHGQGVLAINEVEEGYEWTRFGPLILDSIEKLIASYESMPKFNKIKLQYIDAWDLENIAPIDFVSNNLRTKLVSEYVSPGNLKKFSISQTFDLPDNSLMVLNIANTINNQNSKEAIVWTTSVEKKGYFSFHNIKEWIDTAHRATSDMFKKMLKPEFYASLDS